MYIKEIKLDGFKSFADKITLEFNNNFTGIVGPNGSGKSNIVDAIKWVLGDQSVKSLRASSSMTDVIFAGAAAREKSKRASVTIVFDNSDSSIALDYSEISIKRCVYIDGENEYYLNNEKCRLKDITSLFLDSFNSRDTFNIIAQGKIEEIISDNAESRRIVFEEASGVLKYKNRKEETLRKLEKTHENIERVDLILNELSSSLEPLKEKSKSAQEYLSIKNALEKYDVSLMAKDITQLVSKQKSLISLKEKYENDLSAFDASFSSENANIEKNKIELTKAEDKQKEISLMLMQYEEKISDLNKKIILLKERLKYDKASSAVEKNLRNLKEKELIIQNDVSLLEKDIRISDTSFRNLSGRIEDLSNEYNVILKKKKIYEQELNELTKKKMELIKKIEVLNSSLEYDNSTPYSVKYVLSNVSLIGIESTISKVINVKDEYALAIDNALGASANFVITINEEGAKNAIECLKANNKGSATFYPMNIIKPRTVDPKDIEILQSTSGYIDLASNLVTYDKKYYSIIMNTLGNIIVAENLNSATAISKRLNHRYRVVALDGSLVHVGGSLTGGSSKSSSSALLEKHEITKCEEAIKNINDKLLEEEKIIKEIDYNSEIIKAKIYKTNIELVSAKEILEIKNKQYFNINAKLTDVKTEINDLSSNDITLKTEEEKTMNDFYDIKTKKELLLKDDENIKKQIRNLKEDISDKENLMKKQNSFYNEISNNLKNTDLDLVKINYNLDNLLNKLNEEYSLTYEKALSMYDISDDIESKREEVISLKKKLKILGNVNLDSIKEYDRVNTRYNFLKSQKEDLEFSKDDLLKIINELDEVMSKKFEETFYKINSEFNKVFNTLFGGGEAHLKLTDPSDMLHTGIEIDAVPKGKTLKPISLLSGGEKSLTAVSLLFSIMNLKKVPFVILDEVESALDEANVEKFGSYLSNYRNKTQLLVITHKKKTMEYVDTLYGVTMQESGVSKLVSVKLEDLKKE